MMNQISRKPFRVNLFKLIEGQKSASLEDILTLAESDPLNTRVRKLGFQEYRLELIEKPTKEFPLWFLDFCKLRYDGGPGKASRATAVESIDLADEEGFAEETSMLYNPKNGYAVVQYNHFGPRSGAIAEYLSIYDPDALNDYELRIQLTPDAQARLESKSQFTKLEIQVAPAKLSAAFKRANQALTTALERDQNDFGGDFVTLRIGLEHRSPKSLKLKKWLSGFKRMAGSEQDAVRTLIISGRDDANGTIDHVDLIKEKLEHSIKGLEMDSGKRYLLSERKSALVRAYNGWSKEKIIHP